MKNQNNQNQKPQLLISVNDAAATLGVCPRTVRRYAASGVIPSVRLGKRVMLRTADVVAFCEKGVSLPALKEALALAGRG